MLIMSKCQKLAQFIKKVIHRPPSILNVRSLLCYLTATNYHSALPQSPNSTLIMRRMTCVRFMGVSSCHLTARGFVTHPIIMQENNR